MAYLALYRKFRPSGFKGLVGQDHIVRTLTNQIETGRVGHAYLFCGTRGTGKTSTAKIFAKAINCLSPVDGSPCGTCEVCKALSDPSSLDILEMDAASNNKVENVREIREKIQYPPVSGKYKVYIIDEVHMLTTEAFNALLKTLEEQPKHAVFILATTESHKLPATILSRCMRFDFRLVPTKEIARLVASIYDEVGKEYDKDAVMAIARSGNGSVRDALSIADICVSYRTTRLTYEDVLEVLGATDSSSITKMIDKIVCSNTGETLTEIESLCETGKSIGVLCKDIISRIREIIVCKTCSDAKEILELPDYIYEEIKTVADKTDEHRLLRMVEIFTDAEGSLRYSVNPRVILETACIKASQPEHDYNVDALLARINRLEEALKEGKFAMTITTEKEVGVSSSPAKPQASVSQSTVSRQDREKPLTVSENKEVNAQDKSQKKVVVSDDIEIGVPVFDDGYPDAPPEEMMDDYGGFYGDVPKAKKVDNRPIARVIEEKPVQKPIETKVETTASIQEETVQTSAGGMSGAKLWGKVIRQLRADKHIMLWVACQEMEAKLVGRTLKIIANDDSGYQAIVKDANLSVLANTVKSIGDYEVEVVKGSGDDEPTDGFDADVEKVKNAFGGATIKIED